MELKSYQKEVIADLARYLELVVELQSPSKAYQALWSEKNVMVGLHFQCHAPAPGQGFGVAGAVRCYFDPDP